MRRRIRAAALALATGLAFPGIALAQQDPGAAPPPAAGEPCGGGQAHARANGKSVQPTAEVAQEAQTGCGPGGQGPDAGVDRAGKDVDEMYDRLMKESADDLKGRPGVK